MGWPDFTFCYRGTPIAAECKTETGKLSFEQEEMHAKLSKDGWLVLIVRSVADLQVLFRHIDSIAPGLPL